MIELRPLMRPCHLFWCPRLFDAKVFYNFIGFIIAICSSYFIEWMLGQISRNFMTNHRYFFFTVSFSNAYFTFLTFRLILNQPIISTVDFSAVTFWTFNSYRHQLLLYHFFSFSKYPLSMKFLFKVCSFMDYRLPEVLRLLLFWFVLLVIKTLMC